MWKLFVTVICLANLSLLRASELTCSVATESGNITEGSYSTLNCGRTERGLNTTDPIWYRIDSEDEKTKLSSENGETLWRMTGLDNGVEFRCESRNLTSGDVVSCSLTPFVVYPTASLRGSVTKYILGEETSFICTAEGQPNIAGYRWFINGNEIDSNQNRFTIIGDGKTLTIPKLMRSENDSVITCEAYVASGLAANASLTIYLELPSDDESSSANLWIFIACAAAGGIPVFVSIIVCLAWCLRKTRVKGSQSKKRSQSRRHIVLNEEQNETQEPTREEYAETSLREKLENGMKELRNKESKALDDDGSHPPRYKPAPPPPLLDSPAADIYVNTRALACTATLPNRPLSPTHYVSPRSAHQRKKTEYENVGKLPDGIDHGRNEIVQDDVYENVAMVAAPSRPLSPKPNLTHTNSLPNVLS